MPSNGGRGINPFSKMNQIKVLSSILAIAALFYITNPNERQHRQRVTTYILDHSSLDKGFIEEVVNQNLYCSDYFLYSTCNWNGETIVSRGILFKVTILDEQLQRDIIHSTIQQHYNTRLLPKSDP